LTAIPSIDKNGSDAVRVEGVSKKFSRSLKRSLWYGVKDIVRESLALPPYKGQLRASEFWAVNNISFNVKRGECIGVVGANGSGKTTLLRIISGLIKPNAGCVGAIRTPIVVPRRMIAMIPIGAYSNPKEGGISYQKNIPAINTIFRARLNSVSQALASTRASLGKLTLDNIFLDLLRAAIGPLRDSENVCQSTMLITM